MYVLPELFSQGDRDRDHMGAAASTRTDGY